jgi:uncharacterized membrane-anchored protein YjiN (DUF445 family)
MKLVATGFLVFAAVLYAISFQVDAHGYLRAGSEAAMVGGMADWFAVTAIFRRPLGLPIPHTALIPSRKEDLAARLGSYVTDTFLTPDIVAGQIRDRDIVAKTARWLTDPAQAERIARDIAELADSMLDVLDPAEITVVLLSAAKVDATQRLYAPLIGQLLETTVKDESHRAVSDLLLRQLHDFLQQHRDGLVPTIKDHLEQRGFLAWLLASERLIGRVLDSIVDYLGGVVVDPQHELRGLIDRLLISIAHDLQQDSELGARINAEALRVLEDENLVKWMTEVVEGLSDALRTTLADPDSRAVQLIAKSVADYAGEVLNSPQRIEQYTVAVERSSRYLLERYGDEFTALVEATVSRWDGQQTARSIEVLAGRDLQFIRINGTVVGATVGVIIHALSSL